MERTAEELLRQLSETGEHIATIIRNFSKDSAIRKTPSYYQERLSRLKTAWTDFENADSELRGLKEVDTSDEYFTSDYYTKIQAMAAKYTELMERELDSQAKETGGKQPFTSKKTPLPQTGTSNAAGGHDGLISRALGKMAALTRQLEDLQLQPGQDSSYYNIKQATISQLRQQLENLNDEVLDKYPDPDIAGYDSNRYVHLEQTTQSAIIKLTAASGSNHSFPTEPTVRASALPLPTITIPKFDGDYMKWPSFSDLFKRVVHEQHMSDAHKMWYLKTNVSGEAANLISHLAISEDNYQAAWQLLQDRYNNKRVMVATAVQRLLDQPSGASILGAIKRLHDTTKECLAALSNMGLQVSTWDPLLIHLLIKKVDKSIHAQYEQSISNPKELQSISHFLTFLDNYFHILEAMGYKDKLLSSNPKTCTLTAHTQSDKRRCLSCKLETHPLYRCKDFIQLTPTNRLHFVQKHKLCVNCFNHTHLTKQCTTTGRCQKCGKRHHTLVHLEATRQSNLIASKHNKSKGDPESTKEPRTLTSTSTENATSLVSTPIEDVESMSASSSSKRPYVLLGTALVKVRANGLEIECKAILNVTERLVRRLGLPARPTSIAINGIGKNRTKVQHRVNITLQSRLNQFSTRLEAFVLPQIISPQPTQLLPIDKWLIPNNVSLADPTFNRPDKIDILLGAEYYHQLLTIRQIKLADDLPLLQNTTFGWIVSGKVSAEQLSSAVCGILTEEEKMSTAIERFWKIEEVENRQQQLSPYDAQCEAHFNQHTTRNKEGRFVVRLPFCMESSLLGSSHSIAFNRFLSLERRLSKDGSLKDQYVQFMTDYEAMGHMTKFNIDDIKGHKYFIPHHCVLRPESSTTKLRVVFDASAKTTSGKSLNDILHTGPPLQNDLLSVLLRFRPPRFVFTTDIEKMYRQILLHPKDRQYQIILWRNNASEPINYFQLNTVTYGTRPAPYLAIKCMKEISQDNKLQFPLAANFLERNFYVDDGLGGADSWNTALETQRQLQHVMAKYGLHLRKWCANHTQLLRNIPNDEQEVSLDFSSDEPDHTKTLGLVWLPKDDLLKIKVSIQPIKAVTKRTVTSDLARIFDPLGIISPVVVRAKMFVQELWTLNLSWDEAVPLEFDTRWRTFRSNLSALENFPVHQHIYKGAFPSKPQLHVFTDASERAYGAAIYVRTVLPNKTIIIYLLCAKSRIAPLKQQTLPRLELCAAQLGANLAAKVKIDLEMTTTPTFYWTDSKIVLTWINSRSSSLHTFVANRVASIQENTKPEQWRHVSSKDNPADIVSRGVDPQQLQHTPQWMYGPFFLHGDEKHWPPSFNLDPNMTIIEQKENPHNFLVAVDSETFLHTINHRNSLRTLQRIMGYLLRFIKNVKTITEERQTQRTLIPFELHDALVIIVRITQQNVFKEDVQQLQRQKELKKSSQLRGLSPFLDDHNILRVGGRLEAFIGALRRFTCRRGHCQHLYCDNAINFVDARNQLAELSTFLFNTSVQEQIQRECASKGISFHFIPPRAPHFGGLWEAAVKSAKRLLIKEIANASLTYEEMETVIIEVEAILNSRPISPLSSDPNDEAALTPGHFLIGGPLTAQIDPTAQSTSTTLARRWELVSQIKHRFWTRWSQEYLNELQQRNKWRTKASNLEVGTIVVIKDSSPVMTWRLGRVVETYHGPDGIVRTASIKTSSGVIKRAIHLLAPLPMEQSKPTTDTAKPRHEKETVHSPGKRKMHHTQNVAL